LPKGYARILYRETRADHRGTGCERKVDKLREIASLKIDLLCLGLGPNATVGIRLLGASRLTNGMVCAASRKNGGKRKDLKNPYCAHWRYFSKKYGSRQYAATTAL
jgi:5-methylcytosine-specific restriction endonuclease McrA